MADITRRNFFKLLPVPLLAAAACKEKKTSTKTSDKRVPAQAANPQIIKDQRTTIKNMIEKVKEIRVNMADEVLDTDPKVLAQVFRGFEQEYISHRLLAAGKPEDKDFLLSKVLPPDNQIPYPHFPDNDFVVSDLSSFDNQAAINALLQAKQDKGNFIKSANELVPLAENITKTKANKEGHHGQDTLRLVSALKDFNYKFKVQGKEYTLGDLARGERFKAAVYGAMPAIAKYIIPLMSNQDNKFRRANPSQTRFSNKFMTKVGINYSSKFDISWFIELAAKEHQSSSPPKAFTVPIEVGEEGKIQLSDLIDSQITLWREKNFHKNTDYIVQIPEFGVHMLDMLGTVINLYENDPSAKEKLVEYKKFTSELYAYFFNNVQNPRYDIPEPVLMQGLAGVKGHMLQFIFDPENYNPGDYALDKLDLLNPKTQADKDVIKLIKQTEEALPQMVYTSKCHAYKAFEHLQNYLEKKQ